MALTVGAAGQNRCLSGEEAKKAIESMKPFDERPENKKLRKELVAMRDEREKLDAKIAADVERYQDRIPETQQLGEKHLLRVCQLLKENGFIGRDLVGDDGFEAFIYLLGSNRNTQAQSEVLPVLVEAAKKGYIGNPVLASFVDSIRVGSRMPQIFGTQAAIRNNIVYLYPIQNEEKVDEWRKMYNLPPLAAQIRNFEGQYLMPVLKSQRFASAPKLNRTNKEKDRDTEILGIADDETEPVKIDTRLVNLDVRLLTPDLKVPAGLKLTKDDFTVAENGVEQEISFFSNAEQPFDLVLLLDFSGSTAEKRGLIKKAAQRFVEVARPADRIAVVAFASETRIVSELTDDKTALIQKINGIELDGGSPIWDSLKFVYEQILRKKAAGRRSAIVLMSDGIDASPKTVFADLIEIVRRGETTIFPVYLAYDGDPVDQYGQRLLRKSQQSLALLAEETGGQLYGAKNVKDLSGIYEQVVNELGQVYSLGYEPKNEARDGGWRALTVKVKTQPNLVVKTRRGYYAN